MLSEENRYIFDTWSGSIFLIISLFSGMGWSSIVYELFFFIIVCSLGVSEGYIRLAFEFSSF